MSGHEKKGRPVRMAGKGVIAAPPRVALSGRSNKAESHDDGASAKSAADGNGSEADEAELGTKDKRIAELESKVADYERELTQMRDEKRQGESETAAHWQQKYSSLYKTYLNTDTDLRLLRQEANSFQKGREDRDRDYKTTISTLMQEREGFREAYNLAMGEKNVKDLAIKELQSQIKELQSQVWGLKNFVSASSKMDEQVTDEFFAEQMQRLGNSLQNWVITNFRRAKLGTNISLNYISMPRALAGSFSSVIAIGSANSFPQSLIGSV